MRGGDSCAPRAASRTRLWPSGCPAADSDPIHFEKLQGSVVLTATEKDLGTEIFVVEYGWYDPALQPPAKVTRSRMH